MGDRGTTADGDGICILLVMPEGRDRDLLAEWLEETTQYGVRRVAPSEGIPTDPFDLCLVDARGFDAVRNAIDRHRAASDPVFLPCLLVVPGNHETIEATVGSTVDDTVALPVRKAVLDRRIESLLRARRASLRLAERERQFERLVEQTPEAILLVRDDTVLYANATATDILGVAPTEELRGRSLSSYVHPEDRPAIDGLLDSESSSGETRDLRFRSAVGDVIETEVTGVTVDYGGEPATQLLARDVTDRNRQRRRLDLFQRAVETAAQGITIADAGAEDLPIIYANESFERITGYPVEEILGRNCRFLQGENTDPETVRAVREAIEAERPISTEILNYRKDGTPFWNQLDIVPVRDETGRVSHFFGLQRDITDRKEREERLFVLDRVLRHNIRNRVNVIQGYAEELVDGEAPTAGEHILDAARELLRISDQLRQFHSVVPDGEVELEPTDLAAMVERAAEAARDERTDARIRVDCPETPTVYTHPTLPTALEELFRVAVASGNEVDVTVRTRTGDDTAVLELHDRNGTISASDLRAVREGQATALDHPRGLELWLLRWGVLYSNGGFAVEEGTGAPTVRITLRTVGAQRDAPPEDATG